MRQSMHEFQSDTQLIIYLCVCVCVSANTKNFFSAYYVRIFFIDFYIVQITRLGFVDSKLLVTRPKPEDIPVVTAKNVFYY